jgi:hypothetical protein
MLTLRESVFLLLVAVLPSATPPRFFHEPKLQGHFFRKENAMKKISLFLLCLCISSCVRYTWEDPGNSRMISNNCFDASIEPSPKYPKGFTSFLLNVKNKTDKELTIDWNKSFYIRDGATNGALDNRNRCPSGKKDPDIIFPGGSFSTYVFPDVLLVEEWMGCDHNYLPVGDNGVMLSVICEEKEFREKMNVRIRPE